MTARKPTVLFLNRVYPPQRGATGRMLRDLARAFVADGWDVTVVTTGPRTRLEQDGPIRLVRVRSGGARHLFSYGWIWLRLFWAGMNLPRHDLVVTMTDPPLLIVAGRFLAGIRKSHHIHWCQDLYPDLLPSLGYRIGDSWMGFFRRLSRKTMKKCDRVIVVGRCMARHLTHGGMEPRRVAIIPNWPDGELLPPGDGARPRARTVRKIDGAPGVRPFDQLLTDGAEHKFRILYSGNLGRAHPVETVLDAAALLDRDHPEIEFVFVGDGPGFERLAAERSKRGLGNIRLLPFQPLARLRETMESGDLHLITMRHESAGMLVPCKLYSALAVRRPCILVGPEESETGRVIADFSAGAIVPQGDPARLAREILRFRNDGEAWFQAHEGAARAAQFYIPEESYAAWLSRARETVGPAAYRKKAA